MNITERKAYQWLTQVGHTNIVYQHNSSPDFIVGGKRGFEVKLVRNNVITFTYEQWELLRAFGDVSILAFAEKDEPQATIPLCEIATLPCQVQGITMKAYHQLAPIKVSKESYYKLMEEARGRESFAETVERLLDELSTARKRRVRKSATRKEESQ